MTSLSVFPFFNFAVFFLSNLVTRPNFMSISGLVLELWQFSFIKDWPETWKSEIPPSEFFPISGDWRELRIPNLAQMCLIKCYCMLQNARVTVVPFLSYKGKTNRGPKLPSSPTPRLGLRETSKNQICWTRIC